MQKFFEIFLSKKNPAIGPFNVIMWYKALIIIEEEEEGNFNLSV